MNRNRSLFPLIIVGVFVFAGFTASAMPPADDSLPRDLKAWKSWVLYGQQETFCPSRYNNLKIHLCTWPSHLRLELNKNGGRFAQEWRVFVKGRVALPGDPKNWPQSVTVDGEPVAVVGQNRVPGIYLKPGRYRVEGVFKWADIPEVIRIPPSTGLVALRIEGRSVDHPLRDREGRLWLKKRVVKTAQEDRLEIWIHRLLKDTIPMRITSKIDVHVSGRAREVTLRGLLLDGALPLDLKSPLPTRFGPAGELFLQVRPGRWEVRLETRMEGPVSAIGPIGGAFGQEIWSFESQNHLRMVKVQGVPSVDPAQTNVPADWKRFPAFIVRPGAEISFKEIRRGDPEPAPDQLHLKRTWWLDFNGRGFTVHDKITGTMSRQWSLAMNPPGILGHVKIDGQGQLITQQETDKAKKPGVELRRGKLNLTADSRFEASRSLIPAVGWDHDFQSLSARLNLPPGWRLLTAGGVDVIPGTWFERWSLLDLFLILMIAMAAWKLRSWPWGLLALVTLGLVYHEPGAPRLVWLHLLSAAALLRLLSGGWFRKAINLWFWGAVVGLLVLTIPFMVQQIRIGLYPQLAYPGTSRRISPQAYDKAAAPALEEAQVMVKAPQPKKFKKEKLGLYQRSDVLSQAIAPIQQQQAVLTQDPNALIQTGPGLPSWRWRSISMKWNGPVGRHQQVRLWLLSPFVNLCLAFLRVILLALLIIGLIDLRPFKLTPKQQALVLFLLSPFLFTPLAKAEGLSPAAYPPAHILKELKERLLKPADCFPYCADSPRMILTVSPNGVTILLEIHASIDTAVPLPGNLRSWGPAQVLLDDKPAQGLYRDQGDTLWILVSKGIHRIILTGKTPGNRAFQIPFPLRPRFADVSSEGWKVQGILPEGQMEASLKLTPLKKKTNLDDSRAEIALAPFLHVERLLSLGLTWQVRTTVKRVTPLGIPVVLSIPLLKGESVNTAGIRVQKGQALVHLEPDVGQIQWISSLEPSPSLKLRAPAAVPWTETWILDVSPIWHCETSGIPVIHHQDQAGYWRPQWKPWPAESVHVRISRPKAIPGPVATIDGVALIWTPGQRFNKGNLNVKIRSSRGGQHKILLPKDAKLQSVSIDGKSQPIRKQGRELLIPLAPRNQTIRVEWHQNRASTVLLSGPRVNAGQAAVNAHVTFQMPRNRWILFVGGPRLGPAVLFWSYIGVVILAALALGRLPLTPLKTRHWLLLGLGLTQTHPLVAIMIVGWLLALGLRQKQTFPPGWFSFNLAQVALVCWTAAALVGLYLSIQNGLLGVPHMQIAGNGSSDFSLHWTQDRISGILPQPWVLSLPLFTFRILMLLWALWLAYALLKWLRWGWQCFSEGGLWRKIRKGKAEKQKEPQELETS